MVWKILNGYQQWLKIAKVPVRQNFSYSNVLVYKHRALLALYDLPQNVIRNFSSGVISMLSVGV